MSRTITIHNNSAGVQRGRIMKRTKSIRGKRDPQKPCNIAFREGLEAKQQSLPRNACPYDGDDSYTTYLRAYWLNGHSSQDGINHHATEQSQ
jgi:hypothetical protein